MKKYLLRIAVISIVTWIVLWCGLGFDVTLPYTMLASLLAGILTSVLLDMTPLDSKYSEPINWKYWGFK